MPNSNRESGCDRAAALGDFAVYQERPFFRPGSQGSASTRSGHPVSAWPLPFSSSDALFRAGRAWVAENGDLRDSPLRLLRPSVFSAWKTRDEAL
jgi:hypothetical protein